LEYFKLAVAPELEGLLEKHRDAIIQLAKKRLGKNKPKAIYSGVCLLYLCYVLAGCGSDKNSVIAYLQAVPFPGDNTLDQIANDILDICSRYCPPTQKPE
jgi:hypothetical protein